MICQVQRLDEASYLDYLYAKRRVISFLHDKKWWDFIIDLALRGEQEMRMTLRYSMFVHYWNWLDDDVGSPTEAPKYRDCGEA